MGGSKTSLALGRARGAAHDAFARTPQLLAEAGFTVERADRYQPVSTREEAKMLQILGFEQCVPAYLEHTDATPAAIDRHRAYLERVRTDPAVTIELFPTVHYRARKSAGTR